MKQCCKCKTEREEKYFNKCKSTKDNLQKVCKICQQEWRSKNKKYIKDYNIEYSIENKEELRKYGKKYNIINKSKRKKYHDDYKLNNYDILKERKKKYNSSDIGKKNRSLWQKKDYKKNPHKYIVRHILSRTLRYFGSIKSDKTIIILGYTPQQLKLRIECQFKLGMNWKNYGEWHIDHKKPISAFSENTPLHIINALCNLQPLWSKDNLKKSNKY